MATSYILPRRQATTGPSNRVKEAGQGSALELTDKPGAEAFQRGAPSPGETRAGDRNFGRAASLRRFHQQSDNQDITRRVLLLAVLGDLTLGPQLRAGANVH